MSHTKLFYHRLTLVTTQDNSYKLLLLKGYQVELTEQIDMADICHTNTKLKTMYMCKSERHQHAITDPHSTLVCIFGSLGIYKPLSQHVCLSRRVCLSQHVLSTVHVYTMSQESAKTSFVVIYDC